MEYKNLQLIEHKIWQLVLLLVAMSIFFLQCEQPDSTYRSLRSQALTIDPDQKEKEITSFYFKANKNDALEIDIPGIIDVEERSIYLKVPYRTALEETSPDGNSLVELTPTISIKGHSIDPPSETAQSYIDGTAFTYTITAGNGTSTEYSVYVEISSQNDKSIDTFSFLRTDNPFLTEDIHGIINEEEKTITIELPYITPLDNLVPTISIAGDLINPANNSPQEFQDGTASTYTVTGADNRTRDYAVTVNLSHIDLLDISIPDCDLSPAFSADNLEYVCYLSNENITSTTDSTTSTTNSVTSTIIAEPADQTAYIKMNDEPRVQGSQSFTFTAESGDTTITIEVAHPTTPLTKVYIVSIIRGYWPIVTLKAFNAGDHDGFGENVVIWNDTIVISAPGEGSNSSDKPEDNSMPGSGAVYVFRINNSENNYWTQEAYLKAPNPEKYDRFGTSIAAYENILVIGARGPDSGVVYVFERSESDWNLKTILKAPNSYPGDQFGNAVDIQDTTIIIAAKGEDESGLVYIFSKKDSTNNSDNSDNTNNTDNAWKFEALLKAPNEEAGDQFGESLAIHENRIVVGSTSEDCNSVLSVNGDNYFISDDNNSAKGSGAVYVYYKNDTEWIFEAYLKAPNNEAEDGFGKSVDIYQDTIVVGAWGEDSNRTSIETQVTITENNQAESSGAAYAYRLIEGNWIFEAFIKASNASQGDGFGNSVSIYNNTLVIGARGEDGGQSNVFIGTNYVDDNTASGAGAAYIFNRTASLWTQTAVLKSPNTTKGDAFGQSVSIYNNTIIIGSDQEDSSQNNIINWGDDSLDNKASNSGAAVIFEYNEY